MDLLFVGHRTSGKTTLARALGMLHPHLFEVIDLDAVIEREEERTCAEIIADHEPYFRQLERAYLDKILALPSTWPHRLIVPGAGCMHLPPGPVYVWIQRDGWIDTAQTERARLRARRSFEEEVAWMRRQREPLWASRAHAVCRITRGSQRELDLRRLSEMVLALLQAPESAIMQKSWLVPHDEATLERAIADRPTLGVAGLELRSDFFPHDVDALARHVPVLASLRTDDMTWLASVAPEADVLDVDVRFLNDAHDIFSALSAGPLILSSHPDAGEDVEQAREALIAHAEAFLELHPAWTPHLTLKFAPHHHDALEVLHTLEAMQALTSRFAVTYLPQGAEFAWLRPWLVTHLNATNYLPVTLHARTTGTEELDAAPDSPASLDLHQWLPHLASSPPTRFDALVGDPVYASMGDWWHRMAALRHHTPELGYVKIPLSRELSSEAWHHTLTLLAAIDVRGLSITSPHKRTLAHHQDVRIVDEAATGAVNTLRYHVKKGWLAIDTDHVGMLATLDELEARQVEPGEVAIIGQGGVSAAILRAFEARPAWTLVHHASAREGWGEDRPARVTLVINAAGDLDSPHHNAPECEAWVDLHYTHVRTPPSGRVHLNGETFFVAQAVAQRQFWGAN